MPGGEATLLQTANSIGHREYRSRPNLLRGRLYEVPETPSNGAEFLWQLECNIDDATPVSFEELDRLSRAGEAVIVDVRPSPEFAAGHVEGAINIPLAELDARMAELPVDLDVVAYCRGTYCVMAAHAVARLRAQGRNARRLDGGLPEWRNAGRPVDVAAGA